MVINWALDILCVTYFLTSVAMLDPRTSDIRYGK